MNYNLPINELKKALSSLEEIKTSLKNLCEEDYSNSYVNTGLSGTELSYLKTAIDSTVSRIKNGINRTHDWLNEYITTITDLENDLTEFRTSTDDEPIPFSGSFEDIFGKLVIPSLKSSASLEDKTITLSSSMVNHGGYLTLNYDLDNIIDTFGGQNDNHGTYPRQIDACDDYARGYCLYAQTGIIPEKESVLGDGAGLSWSMKDYGSRKEQAEAVYARITEEGKPCVIHVNSGTGNGHWLTAIGFKEGTTKESVTIADLIVIDPGAHWNSDISAGVVACSEDENYCREGVDASQCEPKGMQVVTYD